MPQQIHRTRQIYRTRQTRQTQQTRRGRAGRGLVTRAARGAALLGGLALLPPATACAGEANGAGSGAEKDGRAADRRCPPPPPVSWRRPRSR